MRNTHYRIPLEQVLITEEVSAEMGMMLTAPMHCRTGEDSLVESFKEYSEGEEISRENFRDYKVRIYEGAN